MAQADYGWDLNVPRTTARRYFKILFHLINKWQNLLICDLSFSQLVRHKYNLHEALLNDNDLDCELAQDITFSALGKEMNIAVTDEIVLPKSSLNLGPDMDYHEFDAFVNANRFHHRPTPAPRKLQG